MKNILSIVLLGLVILNAASFDCMKASTKIDLQICSNEDMSNLDTDLANLYTSIKMNQFELLKKEQYRWIKDRNNYCEIYDENILNKCLVAQYQSRIKVLNFYVSNPDYKVESILKEKNEYVKLGYVYEKLDYSKINNFFEYKIKDWATSKNYTKLLKEQHDWNLSREVCRSKFGVQNIPCLEKMYTDRQQDLEKLYNGLKSKVYLIENGSCKKIERKIFAQKNIDARHDCTHYEYFDALNRSKLLKIKNTMTIASSKAIQDAFSNASANILQKKNCDAYKLSSKYIEELGFINNNILSISIHQSGYDGGTHGWYETMHVMYDRNTGEIITWKDIFGDNQELIKHISDRVQNELADKSLLKVTDNEIWNMFTELGHFSTSQAGLFISFNPYEISNWAAGGPSLTVPPSILKKYMSKDKYEYYFLNKNNTHIGADCEGKYKPLN